MQGGHQLVVARISAETSGFRPPDRGVPLVIEASTSCCAWWPRITRARPGESAQAGPPITAPRALLCACGCSRTRMARMPHAGQLRFVATHFVDVRMSLQRRTMTVIDRARLESIRPAEHAGASCCRRSQDRSTPS